MKLVIATNAPNVGEVMLLMIGCDSLMSAQMLARLDAHERFGDVRPHEILLVWRAAIRVTVRSADLRVVFAFPLSRVSATMAASTFHHSRN